jgi:hypothetical protein
MVVMVVASVESVELRIGVFCFGDVPKLSDGKAL